MSEGDYVDMKRIYRDKTNADNNQRRDISVTIKNSRRSLRMNIHFKASVDQ